MKTALVCIAKNEDNYIFEWIEYHLKLGFDNIFIYANDWDFISKNNKIKTININGEKQQINAYNHFLKTNNINYDWVAFLDVDEFLVLKQHKTLSSFLNSYSQCNAIGINWAIFGNNNHTNVENNNYSVLSRFTKRSDENHITNRHIKTIVKLPSQDIMSIHNVENTWFNLNKEIRSGPFNEPVDWTIAQINHYFTKSDEEFLIKCNRGRADMLVKRNYNDYINDINANQIEDLSALNFFTTLS